MTVFTAVVKKSPNGTFYVCIPNEIMQKMYLRPFMAGEMHINKKCIKIFDFEKTVKIKIDIDKKTLLMAKKIMQMEGYGSLDETISNVVSEFFGKQSKEKISIVYLYPKEYLQGKYWLIDDYEKSIKKSKKRR